MSNTALTPSVVLAAYAEPLLAGRRVAVFGSASSPLIGSLLERGARRVLVLDQDASRRAEAEAHSTSRQVSFSSIAGEAAEEGGGYDFGIVENLADVGDVNMALRVLGKLLTARGAALVCCPNPDVDVSLLATPDAPKISIDYYSLYDAVAEHFDHVRMLGQTPFVGYAVADFAPDSDPVPAMDTGFLPGGAEEPEQFIALCSQQAMLLDEFAIVQLPFRSTWGHVGPGKDEERVRAARAAERRAQQRIHALEAENRRLARAQATRADDGELERMQEQVRVLTARLAEEQGTVEKLRAGLASLESVDDARSLELKEAQAELVRLEEELGGTRHDLTESNRELEALRGEANRALKDAKEARDALQRAQAGRAELDRERQRAAELSDKLAAGKAELEQLKEQLTQQARELKQAREELAKSSSKLAELDGHQEPAPGDELGELEQALRERGLEILRLKEEQAKLTGLARNTYRELEEARSAGVAGVLPAEAERLQEELSRLASLNASHEADLTAARWLIQELEGKLERLS